MNVSAVFPSNISVPRPSLPQVERGRSTSFLSKAVESARRSLGQCFSPGCAPVKLMQLVPKEVKLRENDYAHIGIAGGMGTLAGIDLHKSIMNKAYAQLEASGKVKSDQNLPKTTLISNTEIQDRTAYLNKHGVAGMSPKEKAKTLQAKRDDNPLPDILASIRALRKAGAKVYIVPCNTAHAWADFYKKAAGSMVHVHIVDAALRQALKNEAIKAKADNGETVRIGLLATTGTVKNRIYHDRLEKLKKEDPSFANFEFVTPSDNVQEELVMKGIYDPELGVKANNLDGGHRLLKEAAEKLLAEAKADGKPIDALSLSCTEIPLVLKEGDVKTGQDEAATNVPMIDASDALAQAVLDKAKEIQAAEKQKGKN